MEILVVYSSVEMMRKVSDRRLFKIAHDEDSSGVTVAMSRAPARAYFSSSRLTQSAAVCPSSPLSGPLRAHQRESWLNHKWSASSDS